MFDKYYKKGKVHLINARKQESDGHLKEAIDSYQKAIEEFKAQGFSFHDVKGRIIESYLECGDVYKSLGEMDNADSYYNEAQKYGLKYGEAMNKPKASLNPLQTESVFIGYSYASSIVSSTSLIQTTTEFFTQDPPLIFESHPKIEDVNDIGNIQDLAYYLKTGNHTPEQIQYLTDLAHEIIELFAQRKFKKKEMINEIATLASIPNKEVYEELLELIIREIDNSKLQHSEQLIGLTHVIQNMSSSLLITGEVSTGNLVIILRILHTHLEVLHKQDEGQICGLLQTICPLLDAMVRVGVKGISREKLYTPLYQQLKDLKNNPTLAYYAEYASQALLHIPNDEKLWQEVMRRTFKIASGTINLVNAIRNLDPSKLLDTFNNFSEAFEGAYKIISQRIEFEQTRQWYLALRFIDILMQENQLIKLEQFVRRCSHNKNKWFLVGLCQRLGQIACAQRDLTVQQGAVRFLGNIYQKEAQWIQNTEVKAWVLAILRLLANQDNEDLKNCAKAMVNKVVLSEDAYNPPIYSVSQNYWKITAARSV